jgi:DNA-directed RNA polymerase subunit M/transcription elongation factor TFIIS
MRDDRVTCPECGFSGAADTFDAEELVDRPRTTALGVTCPNCAYRWRRVSRD